MQRWYTIHILSGSERRIKQMIIEQAAKKNLSDYFGEIIIPVVEVPEVKRGKQVKTEKKIMPGYMLVQMELTDDTWHLVQNIPKVTRFLGTGPKPQAVPDSQVEEVLRQLEDKAKHVVNANMYNMGDKVTVTDGPFDTFSGVVEEVDSEKSRLKVSISIFGRATPIDLNFSQVKQES